jgi:hypothetical protein
MAAFNPRLEIQLMSMRQLAEVRQITLFPIPRSTLLTCRRPLIRKMTEQVLQMLQLVEKDRIGSMSERIVSERSLDQAIHITAWLLAPLLSLLPRLALNLHSRIPILFLTSRVLLSSASMSFFSYSRTSVLTIKCYRAT